MTNMSNAAIPGEPEVSAEESVASNEARPTSEVPAATDLDAIRALVLRAHPDVIPELIDGVSIGEMLDSIEPARDAYQRLTDTLRQGSTHVSVPAGGERPMLVDPEKLPASEKIRRGLASSKR